MHRLDRPKPREIGGRGHRREPRPLALDEGKLAAERMRHQQDVGEEDRGIEPEATHRLQRHLGRELGGIAEVEEAPGPRPDRPVLGQVAAGLPHQPDRRHRQGLAAQRPHQRPVVPRHRSAHPVSGPQT